MVLATFRRLLEREIDEETLEKDATGVCTISKLLLFDKEPSRH
jgi:hypothetical protein